VDGLFAPKVSDPEVKQRWRQRIREEGAEKVFALLKHIDPVTAQRLHPNDEQRIVRALEVFDISGIPISSFRETRRVAADFQPVFIGIMWDRQSLYTRIERRVDDMIRCGLVHEVEALLSMGYSPRLNALRTVGYQEVFDHLDGLTPFDEMVSQIKTHSRQYAKRQLTWFHRDSRILWLEINVEGIDKAVQQVFGLWQKSSR
jgi:tRNA dimethylallyltransferase